MKKNSIKIGLIFLLCAFLISVSCLFIFNKEEASAYSIDYVNTEVNDYYVLGQTFTCPEAKVTVDGVSYNSTKQVLYYPDGKAFSTDEHVLSNPGKYFVRYYANINGKSVYAEDEFIVKNNSYGVTGPTSSVYYGNSGEKGNLDGLIVSLAPGDKFVYSKPIDISNRKKTESFISLFAIPEREGSADVREFNVRLTDIADENNFIEIVVYANSGDDNEVQGQPLYYGARAYNQTFSGMHYKGYNPDPSSQILYDGNYYSIYKNINFTSRTGFPSFGSSLAASKGYGYEQDTDYRVPFSFAFDYAERKLYYPEIQTQTDWGKNVSNRLIADFDDSLFFDNLWGGFTTGEVYLSVYSGNYANSSFNFVITDIYEEDLSKMDFEHKSAPKIIVNYPDGELPYAVKNCPYEVFSANAYSAIDGEIGYQVLVYSDYYSNSRKIVPVKNGQFTPNDSSLSYSIVYSATDFFGNYAEEVVDIKIEDAKIATLELNGEQSEVYTGVKTRLLQPVIKDANGRYSLSVKAIYKNEEIEINPNSDGVYELYTLVAGDYLIKYTLTDYNGDITKEYNLTVLENPKAVFVGESILPKVFVKGASYSFPEMNGKSFSDGKVIDITSTIKYSFDDGQETDYKLGEQIKITANENVKLFYSLEGGEDKLIEVPVVDVGLEEQEFQKEKYFYSKQFNATANEKALVYSLENAENEIDTAEIYYVKPILMTAFEFNYEYVGSTNFDCSTVRFIDTADVNNVLKIDIKKVNEQKILVSINDGEAREISQAIVGQERSIKFNCVAKTLNIDGIDFDIKGIKDFTNKTAMFEMLFTGIKEEVTLQISKIGNTNLNYYKSDNTVPMGYLDINSGKKVIGDKIVISGLVVEDVIRFEKVAKLTVYSPDGSICTSIDGVKMKDVNDFSKIYEINVDQLGVYEVVGEYRDGDKGNRQKINLLIKSYDEQAPTITISENDKNTTARVGKAYNIAGATAVDNIDANIEVLVVVLDTAGKVNVVKDTKYTFDKKGVYTIMYYAVDSFGNVGYASYKVVAQ